MIERLKIQYLIWKRLFEIYFQKKKILLQWKEEKRKKWLAEGLSPQMIELNLKPHKVRFRIIYKKRSEILKQIIKQIYGASKQSFKSSNLQEKRNTSDDCPNGEETQNYVG